MPEMEAEVHRMGYTERKGGTQREKGVHRGRSRYTEGKGGTQRRVNM